jgi:hypothetical protein
MTQIRGAKRSDFIPNLKELWIDKTPHGAILTLDKDFENRTQKLKTQDYFYG